MCFENQSLGLLMFSLVISKLQVVISEKLHTRLLGTSDSIFLAFPLASITKQVFCFWLITKNNLH